MIAQAVVGGDPMGWPTCARCQKPVDEIRWWDDHTGARVVEARCHGAMETSRLDPWQLLDALPGGVRFGEAFREGALPAPADRALPPAS